VPELAFTADLQIIDWLDRNERTFDVVTDSSAPRRRRAAVPLPMRHDRSHPEYVTRHMLDAFGTIRWRRSAYLPRGNGFYWVTAYDPDDDQVIEIRRWGEARRGCSPRRASHQLYRRPGGLWRNRNRAPQKPSGRLRGSGLVDAGLSTLAASM